MAVTLSDYLPEFDEIPSAKIQEVSNRLRQILLVQQPELDTNPNSVVGNLIVGPLAQMIAAFEMAADCLFSDLDLQNVIDGNVCNCDFVKSYLENFGVTEEVDYPVITTLQLIFNTNKDYTIDAGSYFLFNDEFLFRPLAPFDGPILIKRSGHSSNAGTDYAIGNGNIYELKQVAEGAYAITLPAVGPAASNITTGSTATTDVIIPELVSVTTLVNVEPTIITSIHTLAEIARKTFASGYLTNRSGTISYITRHFPNITNVSAVVSGDAEIKRDKKNPLGISQGMVDLYVKSESVLPEYTQQLFLSYNQDTDSWIGRFNYLEIPLRLTGVTSPDGEFSVPSSDIDIMRYADNPRLPGLSSGFTFYETLGFSIQNSTELMNNLTVVNGDVFNPMPGIESTPIGIPSPQWLNGRITTQNGYNYNLKYAGIYNGGYFNEYVTRKPTVDFTQFVTIDSDLYIHAQISDAVSGLANLNAYFKVTVVNEAHLDFEKSDWSVSKIFSGLDVWLETEVGLNGLGFTDPAIQAEMMSLPEAKTYTFNTYKSTHALFNVTYNYDPAVRQVHEIVNSEELRPAIDVGVFAFKPCEVTGFNVNYRRKSGLYVDRQTARDEILEYINSATYPDCFETSAIADIMAYAGASGIKSVNTIGTYKASLANYWVKDNLGNDIEEIFPETVNDLREGYDLSVDYVNIGDRNTQYILDASTIELTEVKS